MSYGEPGGDSLVSKVLDCKLYSLNFTNSDFIQVTGSGTAFDKLTSKLSMSVSVYIAHNCTGCMSQIDRRRLSNGAVHNVVKDLFHNIHTKQIISFIHTIGIAN